MKSEKNITKFLVDASESNNKASEQHEIIAQKSSLAVALTRVSNSLNGMSAISTILRANELKREEDDQAGFSSRIVGGLMDALIELSYAAQSDLEYLDAELTANGGLK